ncbi:MAG: putative membrane protein YphA, DoxX/SURF4 family [Verrucomicrobia bacterium]|jgi:uncharacterized membrane protein YphA (DoxX/SURF4 family)|nr:MAG: putative membrane protein YphA, DoxX/SURF4 family [Verrucomicrobiota bacterium]
MKASGGAGWTVLVSRLVFSGVFFWAGWGKLRDPLAFSDSVAAFRVLPHPVLVSLVAVCVPVLEWLVAVLLWVPRWHRAARWVMTGLFAAFTVALGVAQAKGLVIDCGCFGSGDATEWSVPLALGRAGGLLGWAVWYGRRVRGYISEDRRH